MYPERTKLTSSSVTFVAWKQSLRKDCEHLDKLRPFEALPDSVLKLLWESGVEPNVKGLVESASDGEPQFARTMDAYNTGDRSNKEDASGEILPRATYLIARTHLPGLFYRLSRRNATEISPNWTASDRNRCPGRLRRESAPDCRNTRQIPETSVRRSNQLNYAHGTPYLMCLLISPGSLSCPPIPCRTTWPCRDSDNFDGN